MASRASHTQPGRPWLPTTLVGKSFGSVSVMACVPFPDQAGFVATVWRRAVTASPPSFNSPGEVRGVLVQLSGGGPRRPRRRGRRRRRAGSAVGGAAIGDGAGIATGPSGSPRVTVSKRTRGSRRGGGGGTGSSSRRAVVP